MFWLIVLAVIACIIYVAVKRSQLRARISHLPETFVVFDLETTGLDCEKHEIIEIGAIRVLRESKTHATYQTLVKPTKKVPALITRKTGITQAMVDADGVPLDQAVREFIEFVGDCRLIAFNAQFDMSFIQRAASQQNRTINNNVSCALKMARRAFPGRKSYRLDDLSADGNLGTDGAHRALKDSERALIVYASASARLGTLA